MADKSTVRKTREVADLWRNISSFSNKQAKVVEGLDENSLDEVKFVIQPNDGPYNGGTFEFSMSIRDYPCVAPTMSCSTPIYHPNIDCLDEHGYLCLNILGSEWEASLTLEDVVQGVLFLFYNPNFEEPLSPMFEPPTTDYEYDEYLNNIRKSLTGMEVEGYQFRLNYNGDVEALVESIREEDKRISRLDKTCGDESNDEGNDGSGHDGSGHDGSGHTSTDQYENGETKLEQVDNDGGNEHISLDRAISIGGKTLDESEGAKSESGKMTKYKMTIVIGLNDIRNWLITLFAIACFMICFALGYFIGSSLIEWRKGR